ncbi:MAG: hypothetical protein KAV43_00520 [Hadesarchaea archaeon]|nr:hypothetical protein [Hadesarchaea archaeon]
MARKKSRKKLRVVREFAVKIFGNNIVREVLGFILILGILYFTVSSVLVLALRTDTYWRAVISNSMKHEDESWREYFEARGYDHSQFPLQGGFERGDMLVTQGVDSVTEIAVGEVIVVDTGQRHPLVHRVVDIRNENGEARLTTKGDSNKGLLSAEKSIKPEQIRGKVIFVLPKLGHLSLWYQGE